MPLPACHLLRLHAGFRIPRHHRRHAGSGTLAHARRGRCPCPGGMRLVWRRRRTKAPELARLRQPSLITLPSASALGPSSAEESRVQPPIPLPLPRPLLAPAPRVPVAPGGDAHGPGPRAPLTPSRGRSTGAARPASPIQAQGLLVASVRAHARRDNDLSVGQRPRHCAPIHQPMSTTGSLHAGCCLSFRSKTISTTPSPCTVFRCHDRGRGAGKIRGGGSHSSAEQGRPLCARS